MARAKDLMDLPDNALNLGTRHYQPWFRLPMSIHSQKSIVDEEFAEETRIGLEVLALTCDQLPFWLSSSDKPFLDPHDVTTYPNQA